MRIRKETDILDREEIDLIAECSDALAHPARVEIFRFIYKANMDRKTVCNKDVVEAFDYAQATVSQHLSKLVGCGLADVQVVLHVSDSHVKGIGILAHSLFLSLCR